MNSYVVGTGAWDGADESWAAVKNQEEPET